MKIVNHLLRGVRQLASDNCDDRPSEEVSLIVIHCISLPAGHFGNSCVEALFCNHLDTDFHPDLSDLRGVQVSSHLLIRRDGKIVQFVPFDRRAWHAGVSSFNGRENCNDFSIGIELEGTDSTRFTAVQYDVLVQICHLLVQDYGISGQNVVGHSDIAPSRKSDPGSGFDWSRLRAGMAALTRVSSSG